MNSDDSSSDVEKDKTKEDVLIPQVVDYYKHFSQTRRLPSYFCGTTTELKPEEWQREKIKHDVELFGLACDKPDSNLGRPPLIGQAKSPVLPYGTGESSDTQAGENVRLISPASSIASNRKLEWDNGADIGYDNCQIHKTLQKSTSLPAIVIQPPDNSQSSFSRFSPEGHKTDSSSHLKHSSSDDNDDEFRSVQKEVVTSDDDSDTKANTEAISSQDYVPQVKDTLTSSTDSGSKTERATMIKVPHESFRYKIGNPVAESTPVDSIHKKDVEYSATPVGNKPERRVYRLSVATDEKPSTSVVSSVPVENNSAPSTSVTNSDKSSTTTKKTLSKKSSSCENLVSPKTTTSSKKCSSEMDLGNNVRENIPDRKVVNLCMTKPITVECISSKSSKDKIIQTSVVRNSSASVQTEKQERDTRIIRNISTKQKPRSAILYTQHSDTEKDKNTHSSSAQTDSDVFVSKCHSFEYLYGEAYDQNIKDAKKADSATTADSNLEEDERETEQPNLQQTDAKKSDSEKSGPDSSNSKSVPLGQLISQKQSNHLITDIERSITLIQKLANSKRYDDITKKYYLKKVIEKIVGNCYSGDSSETSEAKAKEQLKQLQQPQPARQENNKSRNIQEQNYLLKNTPWLPARADASRKSIKKNSRLKVQLFSDEIPPENNEENFPRVFSKPQAVSESSDGAPNVEAKPRLKRSHFTLAKDDCAICYPLESSTTSRTSSSRKAVKKDSSSWKEEKTVSERLFEAQQLQKKYTNKANQLDKQESGDHLLNFARRERRNQLNWISNEISHLSRLKLLLEKEKQSAKGTDGRSKTVECILSKPQVQDLKGIKKSTTVYMITTEKSDDSSMKETETDDSRRAVSDPVASDCSCGSYCLKSHTNAHRVRCAYSGHWREENNRQQHAIICQCCSCHSRKIFPAKQVSNSSYSSFDTQTGFKTAQASRQSCKLESTVSMKSGPLDIKNAQLVSNQVFKTCSDRGKTKASVYRYTFEIPLYDAKIVEKPNVGRKPSEDRCLCCEKKKDKCVCCAIEATSETQQTDGTLTKEACTGPCAEKEDKKCLYKPECKCSCTQTSKEGTENKCICTYEKKDGSTDNSDLPEIRTQEAEVATLRSGKDKHVQKDVEQRMGGIQTDNERKRSRQGSVQTDRPSQPYGVQTDQRDISVSHRRNKQDDQADDDYIPSNGIRRSNKEGGIRTDGYIRGNMLSTIDERQNMEEIDILSDDDRYGDGERRLSPTYKSRQKHEEHDNVINKVKQISGKGANGQIQRDRYERGRSGSVQLEGGRRKVVEDRAQSDRGRHDDRGTGKHKTRQKDSTESGSPKNRNKSGRDDDDEKQFEGTYSEDGQGRQTSSGQKRQPKSSRDKTDADRKDSAESIQSGKSSKSSSSSSVSSSSSSSSSASDSGVRLCPCCRKNRVSLPSQLSIGGGVPSYQNKPNEVLCHPCYMGSGQMESFGPQPYYTQAQHVCNCYTVMKPSTVQGIQNAVQELQRLEAIKEYCNCLSRQNKSDAKYCSYCKCKLKKSHKKKGIAYQITFEKGTPESNEEHHHKRRRSLEEVKIKVPVSHHHKKHKDKKNKENRKEKENDNDKNHKKHHEHSAKITLQVL